MENTHSPFTSLLIVVFLAFIVPVILARFKKLRLPIVVGEILAGLLIGRSGFGWVSPDEPILDFIAEFGFIFLMFLSGMEIDFSSLGGMSRRRKEKGERQWGLLPLAAVSFGLTLALSALIGLGLVRLGLARNLWMMGLILSTTSLGVVVPVLKEKGLISGPLGQAILLAAVVADFVTMFLITVLVAVLSKGITLDILLIGLLFVAFFIVLRFGHFYNRVPGGRRVLEELSHATAQIKVRAAFTIMLAFVVLSAVLGTEVILGAFLAGACIALLMVPGDEPVVHQLETIGYGFLIPVFFIKVGIDTNLQALAASPQAMLLAPLLVVAALAVKLLPTLVFRLRFSWRETLSVGALLSARLSLIIAASAIGLRLGILSEATNAAITLVAILTVTFAPLAFSALVPAAAGTPARLTVVVGAEQLGLQVAEQLRAHQERVLIFDEDAARLERARQRGFEALQITVEADDPGTERALANVQTLVCTYTDAERCFRTCQAARTVYGVPHVVAQVSAPGDLIRFEQIGVSTTNAALDHAALLTMLARNPATYALLTRTNDDKEVYEAVVENPACCGHTLRQLQLPGDTLVLAVRRNGELLVPHGNTQIEQGDYLTLVSSLEFVALGKQMFACGDEIPGRIS